MEILELLNKKFQNKYSYLRVLDVEYNTLFKIAEITFLYPENVPDITNEDKQNISNFIDETLDLSNKIKCKFKRSFLDENIIKKSFLEYLKTAYPSVFSYDLNNYIDVKKINEIIEIYFSVNEITNIYLVSNNVVENSLKFLNKTFIGSFKINIIINNNIVLDDELLIEREKEYYSHVEPPKKVERYEVFEPTKLFGDDITPMPEFISAQDKEKEAVILAGKVSLLKEGTYVSKRNKLKGINEQSYYYSFTLTDDSGKLQAIYFSSKTNLPKIRTIKDGDSVLIVGNIKRGMKDLSVHIKSLSLCEIISKPKVQETKEIEKVERIEDVELESPNYTLPYKCVTPVAFECAKQSTIFEAPKQYNQQFLSNKYVVFDVETTGLDANRCEIIEIGSVKIENGKIIEKFQTLIKPSKSIPDEIIDITGITDEMVENAPAGVDVIMDFYKFCQGCIIVGYNVDFDFAFLQNLAKKVGVKFPNETLDALVLAKQKLYLPKYKLINVVNALGLELNNAHRAYADALATAEVLQKLNEI
ncbi:MAG: ribonuclease H-like domain-containing protein [Clostridia bacterium]|nr:ribonuclease H-like domain-containing protein [Clostridia bacterium]